MLNKYTCLLYFLCYCVWRSDSIQVKMVPEYFWDFHHGGDFTDQCNMPCVLSEDPSQPDALFFLSMGDGNVRDAINYQTNVSIKIIGTWEAQHYYPLHKIEYLNRFFQGTALLDWTSDIPWLTMPNMDEIKAVEMPENPAPNVTFVARNCNPMNNRMDYVKAIDNVIGVVSLSSCHHNTPWPQCEGRVCTKVEAIRGYKINLAFENGDSPNYVSEKIYHAFEAGVLPVWMGTRGIAEAVPRGSYIDVANFASPDEVAQYLAKVLADDDLYRSYFEWKWKPFDKEFDDRFRVLWTVPFECRMCRYIEALQKGLKWDKIKQMAINPEENPTEETPTEESPTEESPTEEDPTEESPTEESPTEENPTEENPTEESPTEENPTEEDPTEENPTEEREVKAPIETGETKLEELKNETHKQPIIPIVFGAYRSQLGNGNVLFFYLLLSCLILTLVLIFRKYISKFFQR